MESVEAFHVRVAQVRKRLGSSRFPAWYRGHADSAHQLLPGLLRRSNGARHERNLFANFKATTKRYCSCKRKDLGVGICSG